MLYPNGIDITTGIDRRKISEQLQRVERRFPRWHEDLNLVVYRHKRTPVIITQHFSETTVTPGIDINLQCVVNGPARFVWERDGIVVSSNTDSRYSIGQTMTADGGVLTHLNISHVRVDDGGRYACRAHHDELVSSHEDRLNVYGPPYIRTLPPVKVQSGQSVELRCPYYGFPIREITWEHRGKEIKSDKTVRYKRSTNDILSTEIFGRKPKLRGKREIATVSNDGVLLVQKASKSENGASFACIVRSPSGEMAKRSFELQVVEAPQLEEIFLASDLQEGQIVQIHCNLKSGDSPVYYSWLKDGKKIPTHLKIVERSLEVFSVLIIKNVSLDHCGTYTCVAANHVAKVNRTVNLYIKVAPKWSEEPQNTSLLLGRNGYVSCSANGYPQPQTHWLKKEVVSDTWRPVLEIAGGGVLSLSNGSLIFDSVALSDAGLYTCHVENGVGEALSKTIWISVNKPVTFDIPSRNVTAKLGQHVALECAAKGDDPIRVMWTRNGKPVNPLTQRVKISEAKTDEGMTSLLELQQTETSDGALYQCKAGNPFGADVYSVYLTILEPPIPPSDLSVDSVRSRSVKLSWRDTHSVAQYFTVQVTNNQRLSWSTARTVNVTRLEEVRHSIDIDDLQPATSYLARVAGGNQADLSSYSTPVRFTTTEEAPSSPPVGVQLEQTDTPGELRARWLPPPADTHNGLILGYRLRAVPQLTGIKESQEANDKIIKTTSLYSKQETVITGLLKGVRYSISIAAFNSAGSGPFSIPLYQDTREGAPEEGPSSVECGGVTSTSLRVSWQPIPPHKQAGALIGYSVLYAAQGRPWVNTSSLVTELRLQGLLKYTNYTVKVAGYSNYGVGPFSFPIVCSTLQDVPDAPAEIKLLSQSTSTLLVSWKKPSQPNGRLLHYTVYCKATAGNDSPQIHRVDAEPDKEPYDETQNLVLKGLYEGRQYDVWVTASTAVGEGPESRHVTNTPSQRVVAGVWSLGGEVRVAVRRPLRLACASLGAPPPRTVWYHNHNIITHHPRFTRNRDDSLLINSIDQSLSGNYTCLAKNLYGSDSVVYTVRVLPLPDPPVIRATPYKDSILVEWDEIKGSNDSNGYSISYNLTWCEEDGPWQESWPAARHFAGTHQHALTGLRCGTRYSLRVTATDSVGTSSPAHLDVSTLGGAPISPTTTDWLWSNATHIYIQLSGWDDGGCAITKWDVEYRLLGSSFWHRADNVASTDLTLGWGYIDTHYQTPIRSMLSYAVGSLVPGSWYQLRVTATNDAGTASTVYTYATKTVDGEEIGPPSDLLDLNMLVIICSSVLLLVCLMAFVCILLVRHRHYSQYRHSIPEEVKSRNESVASHSDHKERYAQAPRIYTSPVHPRKISSKNEMFEISPYAEFALGFRTFDHAENQDLPSRLPSRPRFDTETSFQTRSESDDSDSTSKATVTAVPRRQCRTPHHR
ncbi:Down syndrome cell adhesion molecule-like protein Dscam2 [Aricia agestis]|uniref:Down syndrome cell adhesion molecule-like protein Dscam2 n=1 Tax=Aricia agestis TaxID=91739 RepID=UPI001C205CF1|nr:Down syndrome cell adhesion molecule-like protein Dscam2 [Aricia agestis]